MAVLATAGVLLLNACGTSKMTNVATVHSAGETVTRAAAHYSFRVPAGLAEVTERTDTDVTHPTRRDQYLAIVMPTEVTALPVQDDYLTVDAVTTSPLNLADIAAESTSMGAQVGRMTVATLPALTISEVPMSNPEIDYVIDLHGAVSDKANVSGVRVECHWNEHKRLIQKACDQLVASLKIS